MSTDKIESLILAVEQAINEEDFEKIIDGCTSIIALDPKNADAYANRASAYAAREDFASALKDHDQSVLLYPDSVTYSNRARSHFESGHPKLALDDFTKAIELSPSDSQFYSDRGTCYLALEDYEEALLDFNKAISLDPENHSAIGNRGNVHDCMGNFEEAIEDFSNLLKTDPMNMFALFNRSNVYYESQKFDLAIEDLTTALKLAPDNSELRFNRANAYFSNGQLDEALTEYSKVIAAKDETLHFQALKNRAHLHGTRGNTELAEADIAMANELALKDLREQQFQRDDALLLRMQRKSAFDKVRKIDHTFFGSEESLQAVQKRLNNTSATGQISPFDADHILEFSEMYIPQDIKTRTAELLQLAFDEGATYDGWGTAQD